MKGHDSLNTLQQKLLAQNFDKVNFQFMRSMTGSRAKLACTIIVCTSDQRN